MSNLSFPNNNIGYLCTDWQVERGLGPKTALKLIDKDENLSEFTFAQLTDLSNQQPISSRRWDFKKATGLCCCCPKRWRCLPSSWAG